MKGYYRNTASWPIPDFPVMLNAPIIFYFLISTYSQSFSPGTKVNDRYSFSTTTLTLPSSYALSLLYNLNINVGHSNTSADQHSFYVPPSIPRFNHDSNKAYRSREDGRAPDATFELSLRSTQGVHAPSDGSRVTLGKPEEGNGCQDVSNNHVSVHSPETDQPGVANRRQLGWMQPGHSPCSTA